MTVRKLHQLPRRTVWSVMRTSYRFGSGTRSTTPRRIHQPNDRNLYERPRQSRMLQSKTPQSSASEKSVICLVIAAHNEELVLADTLHSAMNAGMKPEHIYVVDDNSTDLTTKIARSILPYKNVLRLRSHNGKGTAITKANNKFALVSRYRWIHVADADGAFAPNYFAELRKRLRVENAAATGYMRSLPGKSVSDYRAYEYTIGMEFYRRIQVLLGVIPVVPGPTSCFRADVFAQLNFDNHAMTEDFDVTLQIYRKKLGKIQYIPQAIAYTQDPPTVKAFVKQVTRWYRGGMQVMSRHKIGSKLTPIDAYLGYQVFQGLLWFMNLFVWLPYMVATRGGLAFVASLFLMDVFITLLMVLTATSINRRWDTFGAFPIIYALKWMNLLIFMKSFVEVIVLRRFRISSGAWENDSSRRYRVRPA
jgi:cellulose synthase/poly-beta-1,6-N-acetylglucosamine synthase-like glycosyltransferase